MGSSNSNKSILSVISVIAYVALLLFILTFFRLATVVGVSMQSSFNDNDLLFVESISHQKGYETGDVVIINEDSFNEKLIKRVIATPGDTLKIEADSVYVNGKKLSEPYINEPSNTTYELIDEFKIPNNYYFVMGDNRNYSVDSRNSLIGLIGKEDIKGKVIFNISSVVGLSSKVLLDGFTVIFVIYTIYSVFIEPRISRKKNEVDK